jgi:hypothetical protein
MKPTPSAGTIPSLISMLQNSPQIIRRILRPDAFDKSTARTTMRFVDVRAFERSKSEMSPPGPTPSMKRPLLMWSNWAASAATIAGW